MDPVKCSTDRWEALWGQHRKNWTSLASRCREGKKQCSDYTEDVSVSSVYSISYANPLPKSDLSCDGQIIQLSEVSGLVITSQLFHFLSFHRLSFSSWTHLMHPALQSTVNRLDVSQFSLPAFGKKTGCPFPALIRKTWTISSKSVICTSGKGGLNRHDLQMNGFQAPKLNVCYIFW